MSIGRFFFLASLLIIASSQPNGDGSCQENEVWLNDKCRCLPPKVKVAGSCQVNCPSSTFLDLTKHSCESCDSTCSQCWGPSPNQCLSCTSSLLYNPFLGTCEATCQQGVDGGRGVCVGNTASCTGLVADTPFISSSSRECMSVCNQPYDLLGSSLKPYNLCGFDQCDQSCGVNPQTQKRQCLGKWQAGSCLACDKSNGGVQVQLGVTSNGQPIYDCVNQPPSNSYYSSETDTYFMCSPQCNGCSGSPDNCVTCDQDGWVLLLDGSCGFECPIGTVIHIDTTNGKRSCVILESGSPEEQPVIEVNPTPGVAPTPENPVGEQKPSEDFFIKKEQPSLVTATISYNDAGGSAVSVGVTTLQAMKPGSSSAIFAILLVNLLQFIRYLSINYPPNLAKTFKEQSPNTGSLNFGPLVPKSVVSDAEGHQALPRFARFGINGLFLVNFWRGVTTSIILAIGCCVTMYLQKVNLKKEIFVLIREKLTSFLLWNFIISFVLSNIDCILIFTIVEYQQLQLNSALSVISFILNLVFITGALLVLAYIPWRLYKIRKENPYKSLEEKLKDHDKIKVLFERCKNKYFAQELILFFIGLRSVLHNIIVVAIDSPTIQCSLLLVMSFSMITYLILMRPQISILENIELLGYEAIVMSVDIICLYLSTLDPNEQFKAEDAGSAILVCNILMLSFSVLMTILKIGHQALKFIKEKRAETKAKKMAETAEVKILRLKPISPVTGETPANAATPVNLGDIPANAEETPVDLKKILTLHNKEVPQSLNESINIPIGEEKDIDEVPTSTTNFRGSTTGALADSKNTIPTLIINYKPTSNFK